MNYASLIKDLARGAQCAVNLSELDAEQLFGAILDGGVPEFELGAILVALRVKGESESELIGFLRASVARMNSIERPRNRPRPIVLPTYNGSRRGANLTPLVAMILRRFGVPVLLHGSLESYGRVTSAHVLRQLGMLPTASLVQTRQQFAEQEFAFAPTAILSPGLAQLLSLRARLGLRNVAHTLVKLLDPFGGDGLVVSTATHPPYLEKMRGVLGAFGATALLFRGSEGEPYANPKRRPTIELLRHGESKVLFDAEHDTLVVLPGLPDEADALTTANWIRRVIDGDLPVPMPILNQVAACLYGCGYADDLAQAKALVSVELNAHSHA